MREWAASALAHVVSGDFGLVMPRLLEWVAHPSPNVRRMVAVAAGYATRDCAEGQSRVLLDLLTPLMSDPDPYVGKNLGAFALGRYFLRYRPELVAEWAASLDLDDARTAWNLAMMFTTSEGAKRVLAFQPLLTSLVADERKSVRSAMFKALKNIAKRNEPALTALLATWRASPSTRDAASRVSAHLSF